MASYEFYLNIIDYSLSLFLSKRFHYHSQLIATVNRDVSNDRRKCAGKRQSILICASENHCTNNATGRSCMAASRIATLSRLYALSARDTRFRLLLFNHPRRLVPTSLTPREEIISQRPSSTCARTRFPFQRARVATQTARSRE